MKRKYTIFSLIILLTFLILVYRFYTEKMEKAKIDERVTNNYTLISINGVVQLFRDDILIQIYDNINVNTLPLQDQDNLKSGIKVDSIENATALVEDFDG